MNLNKLIPLIIAAVFIIQAVVSVIQHLAKKQQQERMQELAEQRRRQTAAGQSGRTGTAPDRTGSAPGPRTRSSGQGSSRLETLAARRKAQLEELRRRRAAASSTPPAQAKVGSPRPAPAPQPPTAPAPVPVPPRQKSIHTLKADPQAIRAAQAAEARRRREQQIRQRAQEEATARREQEELRRRRAERDRRKRKEETPKVLTAVRSSATDAYADRAERTPQADRVAKLLSDRQSLRDMFIIRELLDAPVSLRSGSPGDRA